MKIDFVSSNEPMVAGRSGFDGETGEDGSANMARLSEIILETIRLFYLTVEKNTFPNKLYLETY